MDLFDGALVGVFAGSAYAVVAVSITLMFRTTGVLSFAHAAFAMVAAYVYADLSGAKGWPAPLACLVALAVTVLYGLVVERVAIRPVSRASGATRLIVTLGVLSLTTGLILEIYGFQPTRARLLLPDGVVRIGDLRVTYQQVATLVVAGIASGGLGWFLRRTRFGMAVRAVAQSPGTARLMGVSLVNVARFNWGLGALLAGLAGILVAPLSVVTAATFPLLLAKALTATLFGGLASLPLTFAGGLLVGIVENVTTLRSTSPGARELSVLLLVVGLLALRRSWATDVVEASGSEAFAAAPSRVARSVRRLARAPVIGSVATAAREASTTARSLIRPLLAPLAVGMLAVAVLVPAGSNYWGFVGARGLFFTIQALSIVVLVGWGGQVSLMHGAYVGLGAYTTAYFVGVHGVPLELALPLAGVATMGMGAVAGIPALRLSGLQFAIASLVFSAAAAEWLFKRREFLDELPRSNETLFGVDLFSDSNLYLIMLPITALLYLLVRNVRASTFGPLLIASRDAPSTVTHFGAAANRTRMVAFLLASFIAGLGGGLYGVLLTSFQPFDFSYLLSISLLIFAVVGGMESLAGPLVAGVLFGVLPQVLQGSTSTTASAWPDIVAGATVIALLAFRPNGLAGILGSLLAPPARRGDRPPPGRHYGRFDLAVAASRTTNGAPPAAGREPLEVEA